MKLRKTPLDFSVRVMFTQDQVRDMDRIAKKLGIDRSKVIRNLTLTALDDAMFLEKVGILKVVEAVRGKEMIGRVGDLAY